MGSLMQDLRYSIRMFAKNPGFAAIAILTLALGIGANTALFSVVNGVLLNPLEYPHSEQLVTVYGKTPGFARAPISYLNFLDWQRATRTFSSMALYRNEPYNLAGTAETELVGGSMISADFFPTLGVAPILGRNFRTDDDRAGAAPVVMLGGGLWKRKFGSSPDRPERRVVHDCGRRSAKLQLLRQRAGSLHSRRPVDRSIFSGSPHRGERPRNWPPETGRNTRAGKSGHGRHFRKSRGSIPGSR